ncbi:MAG TPA: DUF72 domain-containing protein [Aestuariivirgaceae bacterium]|jgi:uncharacterized protein YecE (DUF72 family)
MIRVGVGGWTYEPWRGTFYPKDLKHADELKFASRHLTTIEINGTFYRTQSAASFRKWRDETPDDFVFSVKGHRAVVNSRKLADAGEPIQWFFKSGVLELGDKLGPVLWQFAPFRKFNAEEIAAFLKLLPRQANGRPLRHAVEVRHDSFLDAQFVDLLRQHEAAAVFADSDDYPAIADVTSDFVYARLQRSQEKNELGYSSAELDHWTKNARSWQKGLAPEDLPRISKKSAPKENRAVFIYMIAGAKIRCPLAAQALIQRLGGRD